MSAKSEEKRLANGGKPKASSDVERRLTKKKDLLMHYDCFSMDLLRQAVLLMVREWGEPRIYNNTLCMLFDMLAREAPRIKKVTVEFATMRDGIQLPMYYPHQYVAAYATILEKDGKQLIIQEAHKPNDNSKTVF